MKDKIQFWKISTNQDENEFLTSLEFSKQTPSLTWKNSKDFKTIVCIWNRTKIDIYQVNIVNNDENDSSLNGNQNNNNEPLKRLYSIEKNHESCLWIEDDLILFNKGEILTCKWKEPNFQEMTMTSMIFPIEGTVCSVFHCFENLFAFSFDGFNPIKNSKETFSLVLPQSQNNSKITLIKEMDSPKFPNLDLTLQFHNSSNQNQQNKRGSTIVLFEITSNSIIQKAICYLETLKTPDLLAFQQSQSIFAYGSSNSNQLEFLKFNSQSGTLDRIQSDFNFSENERIKGIHFLSSKLLILHGKKPSNFQNSIFSFDRFSPLSDLQISLYESFKESQTTEFQNDKKRSESKNQKNDQNSTDIIEILRSLEHKLFHKLNQIEDSQNVIVKRLDLLEKKIEKIERNSEKYFLLF